MFPDEVIKNFHFILVKNSIDIDTRIYKCRNCAEEIVFNRRFNINNIIELCHHLMSCVNYKRNKKYI